MPSSALSRSSEFWFVTRASSAACDELSATGVGDWSAVFDIAHEHRVLPRVWRNALRIIPQPHAQRMRDVALQNTRNALQILQRTVETIALLETNGVAAVVLKGPLLARQLYGDFGLRVCSDVDLLVRPSELGRAAAVFANAGYHHHTRLDAKSLRLHRQLEHDVAFAHPEDGTLIELHADIAQPHYSYRVRLDQWWAARQPTQVGAQVVQILKHEHAYVLAVLHAARHRWSRLDLICDVAAFGALPLERDLISAEAQIAGLERILHITEALADHFYRDGGVKLSRLESGIAAQVVAGIAASRWNSLHLDFRSRERPQDRIRYLMRRFVHNPLLKMRQALE